MEFWEVLNRECAKVLLSVVSLIVPPADYQIADLDVFLFGHLNHLFGRCIVYSPQIFKEL